MVDTKTLDALDLQKLVLPKGLPVTRLEAQDYTNWEGEEALRILVILAEDADVDNVSGKDVGQLKSVIRDSLRDHGVTRFAYFTLAKQSELSEGDDEE